MFTTLIDAKTVNQHLDQSWVIVDVRFALKDTEKGRMDYQAGHIPGAFYAHLDEELSGPIIPGKTGRHPLPSLEKMVQLFGSWGITQNTQVVIYDQLTGAISSRLWWMLNWLGHQSVAVLNGGWQAWVAGAYPTSTMIPSRQPTTFQPQINHDLLVSVDQLERMIEAEQFALVDSRAHPRFLGREEPLDPVAGHIPSAINMPFMENVDHQGLFKPANTLKNRFKEIPNHQDKPVFYCGSGVTACHNILAFKHVTGEMPRLYAGSWSEWITDESRQVIREEDEEHT